MPTAVSGIVGISARGTALNSQQKMLQKILHPWVLPLEKLNGSYYFIPCSAMETTSSGKKKLVRVKFVNGVAYLLYNFRFGYAGKYHIFYVMNPVIQRLLDSKLILFERIELFV